MRNEIWDCNPMKNSDKKKIELKKKKKPNPESGIELRNSNFSGLFRGLGHSIIL